MGGRVLSKGLGIKSGDGFFSTNKACGLQEMYAVMTVLCTQLDSEATWKNVFDESKF